MFRIGIDLGGTKIEGIALDEHGREVRRQRIPTQAEGGVAHIIGRIAGLYAGLVYAIDDAPHTVGVGTPGAISPRTGLLKNSNTTCLNGQPLDALLVQALHHSVTVANDANCFALAEALMGAGRGHACVFGVIMGTGCGGGLCIDGVVREGSHRIAGEWGHFSVDPAGAYCYCGNRGCVETLISGSGVEAAFLRDYGERLGMDLIVAGARSGEPRCHRTFARFLDDFGRCLGGLISVLDPDAVVLGGGLSNIAELYTLGNEQVRHYAFHDNLRTPILRNELGDSAGVFGAAWIGR